MNRKLTALVVAVAGLSLLAAPQAFAAAPKAKTLAQNACQKERTVLGKTLFRATYGKTPMRTCRAETRAEAREALENAAHECMAERQADPAAFAEKYGTNPNKRNAFGKCVSKKARGELNEDLAETKNAAKECMAERRADPAAFAETYGTNTNKRNAFGTCVASKKAGADDDPEEDEPGDDPGDGGGEGEV